MTKMSDQNLIWNRQCHVKPKTVGMVGTQPKTRVWKSTKRQSLSNVTIPNWNSNKYQVIIDFNLVLQCCFNITSTLCRWSWIKIFLIPFIWYKFLTMFSLQVVLKKVFLFRLLTLADTCTIKFLALHTYALYVLEIEKTDRCFAVFGGLCSMQKTEHWH